MLSFLKGRPHKGYSGPRNTGAVKVELVGVEPGGRDAAQDRFWGSKLSRMGVQGRGGKGHSSRRAGDMESPRSSAPAGLFSGSKGGEEERGRWRRLWCLLSAVQSTEREIMGHDCFSGIGTLLLKRKARL